MTVPSVGQKLEEPGFANQLKQADQQAWQSFFEAYAEPLFLYLYHRTSDRHAAEDLRQETFIEAMRSVRNYRREASLFSWLCGIAKHKSAGYLRKNRREITSGDIGNAAGAGREAVVAGSGGLGRQTLVEDLGGLAETRSLVVETLWTLAEDYRKALVLRYVEGLGVGQVAYRIGRSYKATESLLSRARDAFERRYLEANKVGRTGMD